MSLLFLGLSKKIPNGLVWHQRLRLLRFNNITSIIIMPSSSASSSSLLTLPFSASALASASVMPLLTSPLMLSLSSQEEKQKMVIIPPSSHLSIISTTKSTSKTKTKIMEKASIYNCYKNRNNRNNIHLRPHSCCNFSSTSSSSSSNNDDSEVAPAPPGTTLDRLWKESTNRILKFDEKAKPINGKMKSLQWQLIETLILYWSTTTSTSTTSTTRSQSQSSQSSTTTFSSSTMSNNVDISLQLIDRLAEERMAHIDSTTDRTTDTVAAADVDDFRTIDISLIHAMLKHWKECIQNQIRMNIHYSTNTNTNNSNRKRNNNKNQQQQESESEKSIFKLIPSPFEMLQKIDYWNKSLLLVEPNIVTYTIIMDVSAISTKWSSSSSSGKNGDDHDFTENLLYRLIEECKTDQKLQPTIVTIGTVIHSLANTKTLVGAQKAENWLRYLQTQSQQQQQQGNNIGRRGAIVLKPNTIIYTTVMKAYADVGRVHKSEELLREMYTEYTINHNQDVKPTLFTFNTVLGSYSKSKFEFENIDNAIQKSEELIQRMKDLSSKSKNRTTSSTSSSHLLLDVTPDIVSYNSVLSILARRCSKSKIYRQRQQQREQEQQRKKVSLQSSHSNIDTEDDNVDDSLLLLQLLSKAEYWMEEILDNSSINTNNNNNNEIVMPSQITYKILFNIIASMPATDASKTSSSNDKKEKAKQWLLRSNNTKLINDPILLKQINTM